MKFTVTVEIEASTAAEAISKLVNGAATGAPVKTETAKASAPAPAPAKPAAAATPATSAPVPAPATSAPVPAPATSAPVPAPATTPDAGAAKYGGLTLTEVRSVLTPLMTGANVPLKPVITALINTYAGQLSAVDPRSFPELIEKAKALGEEFDNTGVVPSLS